MRSYYSYPVAFALALGAFTQRGWSATTTNLDQIITSHKSLSVGDKIFSDFSFSSAAFSATQATVSASVLDGIYYLTLQGPFLSANGAASDISFSYSVATNSGLPLIDMIDQSYVLTAQGSGGWVGIGETVFDATPGSPFTNHVAQSSLGFFLGVNDAGDPPIEPVQGDDTLIDPSLAKIRVDTDIALVSNPGGLVGATTLRQSFHQTSAIPEPSSILLLGASCGWLTCFRFRRPI